MFIREKSASVKLKNSEELPAFIVRAITMNLEGLKDDDPETFRDFVQKCRNPEHEILEKTKELAKKWSLIQMEMIHDTVKNIVLSTVEDNSFNKTTDSSVENNRSTKKI